MQNKKQKTKKHHSVSFTSREFFLFHMDQTGVERIWVEGGVGVGNFLHLHLM